jgi:predicted enzyme related to lactoylglutathione lyase
MNMTSAMVAAVVYAQDQARVAAFYRDVLGLVPGESDPDHSRLACGGFDLIVHRLPGTSTSTANVLPQQRRERGAIRLIFSVADVDACRVAAAARGGEIDNHPPPWAQPGSNLRLGQDPEGNVFQVQPNAV